MEDHQLVEQILKNNKKAVGLFYKTYAKKLFNFILQKIENPKDAEEILQDTFLSALDSLPLFNFQSSLYTWLCAISHHEIVDFYRRKKLKTIIFSRLPFLKRIMDRALGPELTFQEKEIKSKIYLTLKNLSEGYCQILRLKYIEGISLADCAQQLGKTVKATESYLFRARIAFQKEYAKETQISNVKTQSDKENWQILDSSFD